MDYEGYRLKQGVPTVVTVPTVKMRSGDFSELPALIYDPTTTPRTPFAGNIIPAGRIDSIAKAYMGLYPLPTNGGLANNFAMTNLRKQNNDATDVRVDHRFNDANTVFARYSFNKTYTLTPSLCPKVTIGSKTIDPTLQLDRFVKVQRVELEGGARNVFQFSAAPPPNCNRR